MKSLSAHFLPPKDQQFEDHYNNKIIPRGRSSLVIAAIIMFGYGILDIFMIPEPVKAEVLLIRFVVIVPALLLTWAATFNRRLWPHMQIIGGATAILVGVSVAAIIVIARVNLVPISYEGLILTILYFYFLGGLRLKTATIAGATVLIVYAYAESWAGLHGVELRDKILFLITANIMGTVGVFVYERLARQNHSLETKLKESASRDFLTGLLNRRSFSEKAPVLWKQAIREEQPLVLALMDIDFFKRYNDTYGHSAGDEVLAQVADALQQHARRPMDIVARYGGEEFIGIWYGIPAEKSAELPESINQDIRNLSISHSGSDAADVVTISIGMVHFLPHAGLTLPQVLEQADIALYQAKANGRDGFVIQQLDDHAPMKSVA